VKGKQYSDAQELDNWKFKAAKRSNSGRPTNRKWRMGNFGPINLTRTSWTHDMCNRELNKRMVFSNLMGGIQGLALAEKGGSGFCLLADIHIDGVGTIGFCCQRV